jgi:cyclopropane fatty-acyl-phospholipid synthase-like methyltransferase
MNPWYASWFDSPFYPLLYKHRDEQEAADFLDLLLQKLKLPQKSRILDLACGRGRHSRFLHSRGMQVHGVDLSPSSISDANLLATQGLSFEIRDMRMPWPNPTFDLALSLFTSFGYFDSDEENGKVLKALRTAIHPGGFVLLDFFNSQKVLAGLGQVEQQQQQIGGYTFFTQKRADKGSIVKDIQVKSADKEWEFTERVRAYSKQELILLCTAAGLEPIQIWGSYTLDDFDPNHSERTILLMKPQL